MISCPGQRAEGTARRDSVAREHGPFPRRCHPHPVPVPLLLLPPEPPGGLPAPAPAPLSLPIPPHQSRMEVLGAFSPQMCTLIPPWHPIPTTPGKSRGSQSSPHPSTPLPHLCPPVLLPQSGMKAANATPQPLLLSQIPPSEQGRGSQNPISCHPPVPPSLSGTAAPQVLAPTCGGGTGALWGAGSAPAL